MECVQYHLRCVSTESVSWCALMTSLTVVQITKLIFIHFHESKQAKAAHTNKLRMVKKRKEKTELRNEEKCTNQHKIQKHVQLCITAWVCVCVCVCVCVFVRAHARACVFVCARTRACVCVCACVRAHARVCARERVRVCVCVCVRACVCVCVHVHVPVRVCVCVCVCVCSSCEPCGRLWSIC